MNAPAEIAARPAARRPGPALAWALAGLVLLGTALQLPFVEAGKFGQGNEGRLLSGAWQLWLQGEWFLAGLVGFCGLIAPAVMLIAIAAVELGGGRGRWADPARRAVRALAPWSMPDVRMLAIVVAFVKLSALVRAVPAAGLWCYGAAAFCTVAAVRSFGTAQGSLAEGGVPASEREGEPPEPPRSVALAAACGLGALFLLVPAYLLPVMSFERIGAAARADTIFSSVIKLWHSGLWGLALIVFTASLLVPVLKLCGLAVLVAGARWPGCAPEAALVRVHRVVHGVGRWSMLDVFLVAFLCGIVQFGDLARIEARPGVLAFAGAVILTMIASAAIDARHFETRAVRARDSLYP